MTFTLTEIETACGVTEADVAAVRRDAYILPGGQEVVLARDVGPALAGAAARLALGAPVEFMGLDVLSQPLYRVNPD